MVHIADKLKAANAKGQTAFSFEFFPPRTEEGVENLFDRLERMVAYGPLFCDITWGAGGSTADVTLNIAKKMQNQICVETMMHLTCTNMPVESLESALKEVREAGISNILALRGDPPKGQEKFETIEGGLSCALDLVKYIRETHGDYFGICVAGYPEAHPDTIVDDPVQMEKNYWENIQYLKQKVEAGGEMIITQLFYDVDQFLKFVKDCKSVGITAPIVPGIMPIMTYGGFKRMTGFCKTKVPQDIMDTVEANKDNEEAIKNYGVELGAQMCRKLLDAGVPGLHMYSLNLDKSVLAILTRMGIIDASSVPRSMPWSFTPSGTRRGHEGVRPIFWQHRPRAYMARTQGWTQWPTSRWTGSAQPFAALTDASYLTRHTHSDAKKAKATEAWGADLTGVKDVQACFEKFYKGETSLLPWYEHERKGSASELDKSLASLAASGYLPINAQAAENGVSSSGSWGPAGGHVYAKAYVEVFVSPDTWKTLKGKLQAAGSVSYVAAQATGSVDTNLTEAAASNWAVFPGREVVQPLVVDAGAFAAWREEAFALWTQEWGAVYAEGSGAKQVLADIAKTWYLVGVLDNNYVSGDLLKLFA